MPGITKYNQKVNGGFRNVSKHSPCEICGKLDWCSRSADGNVAVCRREGYFRGEPGEEKTDKSGRKYFVHWLGGDESRSFRRDFDHFREVDAAKPAASKPAESPPPRKRPEIPPEILDKKYRQILHDLRQRPEHAADLAHLAGEIHVRVEALEALGCAFSDGVSRESLREYDPDTRTDQKIRCWIFPAYDGQGRVAGLSRRAPNAAKKTHSGGHLGLFLPVGWEERAEATGTLYVPEGASDAAALWSAGLAAVGRPSNTGGADALAVLLKPLAERGVRIVVVGERDEKPGGLWPGRDGALHTAKALADALGVPVRVVLPPAGVKDSRAWFLRHRLDDAAAWAECGRQLEAGWEEIPIGADSPSASTPPIDLSAMFSVSFDPSSFFAASPPDEESANAAVVAARADFERFPCSCPRHLGLYNFERHFPWLGNFRCEKRSCSACRSFLDFREMANAEFRFRSAECAGQQLYRIAGSGEKDWQALRRLIIFYEGDYLQKWPEASEDWTVFTTFCPTSRSRFATATQPVTAKEALDELKASLSRYFDMRRPISTSHSWKLLRDDGRPKDSKFIGSVNPQAIDQIQEIAETVKASVKLCAPRSRDSKLLVKYCFVRKKLWDEDSLNHLYACWFCGEVLPYRPGQSAEREEEHCEDPFAGIT